MALLDTDLLYCNRGGTNFQTTWGDVRQRNVLPTDEFLLQRGGTYYRVPIGDFWTCAITSEADDRFLVERNQTFYHEEILFPCSVRFSISGATSTTIFASAIPDASGEAPYILQPDGTKVALTATPQAITLTQNGVYEFAGAFTQFQVTGSDGVVDASLDPTSNWTTVFSGVTDFGNGLFQNISDLSGLPAGLPLQSLDGTFEGTSPSAADIGTLDVSEVTSAVGTFLNSQIDPSDDISAWDVSNVTNMARMFEGASLFNSSVAGWDIANVTNMASMFKGANNNNQDLSGWGSTIVNVTNMRSMFEGNALFNQDLSLWEVTNVTDMAGMFSGAASFNQNLGDWDVSNVLDMSTMFNDATVFDQDLSDWCVNLIGSEPANFSTNSPLGTTGAAPVWGTCPLPECGEMYYTGGSGSLRMAGTASAAGNIVKPDGSTQSIGPGNWTFSSSTKGTYHLPTDVLTKLNFANNPSQQFDFAPCFYTGNITDMACMFWNCRQFNGDIANWDTSNVTNMSAAFDNASIFNSDISAWDTSNVTNMYRTFYNARRWDLSISGWDVSNVQDCREMFRDARAYNSDISSWQLTNCTTFENMFYNAYAFNGDLSGWDVSNGTQFRYMFARTNVFVGGDLSGWNTANATNMTNMFENAPVFNGNITTWNTSNVTNMMKMFMNAYAFNQDIGSWDTSNVTNMNNMFHNARAFNHSLNDWDVSAIPSRTQMSYMFRNAHAMNSDLTEWCVGNVTSEPTSFDSGAAFENDTALLPQWGNCPVDAPQGLTITNFNGETALYIGITFGSGTRQIVRPDGTSFNISSGSMYALDQLGTYQLPMGTTTRLFFNGRNSSTTSQAHNVEFEFEAGFYTSALTSMYQTFRNAKAFNADISDWDTSKVTNMRDTFNNADGFNRDLDTWDTSNVNSFANMFLAADLFNGNIANWDTSNVTNMTNMFYGAVAFNRDISAWNVGKVTNMRQMFREATAFNQYLNPWDTSMVRNMANMFLSATAMNNDISNWCVQYISSEPYQFDRDAGFDGNLTVQPDWGECGSFNGIYLRELVGGTGDFVIGGVAADNTVEIRQPDGTIQSIGTGNFANKYTQLGWYEIKNMEQLTGLRFYDNDILFDDKSETADFFFSNTFDASNLTESRQMFREAAVFNSDISMLDLSSVTNMAAMFRNAAAFNQDVTNLHTNNVTNMANMFRGAALVNQDLSSWPVYNVTAMDDMFREATAFNSDLSDWCVPGIASEPGGFDTNAGFDGNTAIQPQWGTCPNLVTIVSPPVIANTNGTSPAPYGEDVIITTPAVTDPATGVNRVGYQWQRSADGSTGWIDIPGSENNAQSATYNPNGHDRNEYIRLVVQYQYPASPIVSAESNVIQVENGEPPAAPLYTTSELSDFPLGQQMMDESTYGYQVTTFLGTDGNFYSYALDSDILTVWSAATGDYVNFIDTDHEGAGINADGAATSRYINWRGGIHVLGESKVILAPGYINHFWVHDYINNTWEQVQGATMGNGNRMSSGLVYSSALDKYYSVPNGTLNSNWWEVEYNGTEWTQTKFRDNTETYSFGCACEGPDDKIYYFPNARSGGGPDLVQLDPATGTITQMTCPVAADEVWSGGSVAKSYADCRYSATSNAIYAAPCMAMRFIKLDFNNMVNGLPTATAIDQTVDTRTSADGSTRGKWHAFVLREDGRFSCFCTNQVTSNDGRVSKNAIFDPADDSCIEDGVATLGQNGNATFLHGAMHPGTGRVGSTLILDTSGSGGAGNQIKQNPMFDTFTPITTYDPLHPSHNRCF